MLALARSCRPYSAMFVLPAGGMGKHASEDCMGMKGLCLQIAGRGKVWPHLRAAGVLSIAFLVGLSAAKAATAESASVVFVTSEASNQVVGVNGGGLKIVRRVPVAGSPHNLELAPGDLLAIATEGTASVSLLDLKKDQTTVRRIPIGAPPHDLSVAADGRTLLVVSERGLFVRLDVASGRILQNLTLPGRPHDIIAWGNEAWTTDLSARRLLIVGNGGQVGVLPISIVGHDLAVRPGSRELWVAPWDSTRGVIVDLQGRREVGEFQAGREPSHKHIGFSEDGSEAWVTEPSSGRLFVVNAENRTVVDQIDVRDHPHHVRLWAGRAYVAVGPSDLVVLDAKTRKIVTRRAVGSEVHDVALRPPDY